MPRLRFVHAADLHLDSPFKGLRSEAPPNVAGRLVNATFEAYGAIIDLCLREQVDAFLVAGDVYDGADKSLRAQLKFVEGLAKLDQAGIASFICHGNHDPLDGWDASLAIPPRVHRFGREVEAVPLDPADPARGTVVGVSYPTRVVTENLALKFGALPRQGFAVGLLHCNVGSNPEHEPYAPCTVDDLQQSGLDYWALGHVHTRQVLRPAMPTAVYPGNPQGRHPNERGPRGVYLVDVDDTSRVHLEFRETSVVRWESASVDISSLESEQALLDAADGAVSRLVDEAKGRDLVFRLQLTGRGELHGTVHRPGFVADLQDHLNTNWAGGTPFAWCERIELKTGASVDRNALRDGKDFVGDLLRLIDAARSDPVTLEQLVAQLGPLYTHHKAGHLLKGSLPGPNEVAALLDDVESLCMEVLA